MGSEKGWFRVPGIRPEGDRSLKEQLMGLAPALEEAKGKTVLDLGCAEALISREFAAAGAVEVLGIELLATHLDVARKVCKGLQQVRFVCTHLDDYRKEHPEPKQFDIVLALGIIHKMHDPNELLRWAAMSARSLLCFRAPSKAAPNYVVRSKHTGTRCNVPEVMREMGFADERLIPGVRGEAVQYWRRMK